MAEPMDRSTIRRRTAPAVGWGQGLALLLGTTAMASTALAQAPAPGRRSASRPAAGAIDLAPGGAAPAPPPRPPRRRRAAAGRRAGADGRGSADPGRGQRADRGRDGHLLPAGAGGRHGRAPTDRPCDQDPVQDRPVLRRRHRAAGRGSDRPGPGKPRHQPGGFRGQRQHEGRQAARRGPGASARHLHQGQGGIRCPAHRRTLPSRGPDLGHRHATDRPAAAKAHRPDLRDQRGADERRFAGQLHRQSAFLGQRPARGGGHEGEPHLSVPVDQRQLRPRPAGL